MQHRYYSLIFMVNSFKKWCEIFNRLNICFTFVKKSSIDNNAVKHIYNNPQTASLFFISSQETDFSLLLDKREKFESNVGKIFLILVLSGAALIEIDDRAWNLHRGVFLFITPRHLVRLLVSADDFTFRFLYSDFDFIADFPLLLKPEVAKVAIDIFHYRQINKVSKIRKNSRQIFFILHKFFKHERRSSFYADKLCISDKHLMRTVKEQTGYSVHYWIADFLIQEAKLMLKSSDKSVIEISDELGFPNSSSFARFFRNHVNLSPLEFKNRASKAN